MAPNSNEGPTIGVAGCVIGQAEGEEVKLSILGEDEFVDAILSPEEAILVAYALLETAVAIWGPGFELQRKDQ